MPTLNTHTIGLQFEMPKMIAKVVSVNNLFQGTIEYLAILFMCFWSEMYSENLPFWSFFYFPLCNCFLNSIEIEQVFYSFPEETFLSNMEKFFDREQRSKSGLKNCSIVVVVVVVLIVQ